jgi:HPt (histidine-containing phosphotransfer) domain-containing protein
MCDLNAAPLFDVETFRMFLSQPDDKKEQTDMLALFHSQLDDYLKELEIACIKNNNENWIEIAHKIKGMCSFVGATNLREICEYAQKTPMDKEEKEKTFKNIQIISKETVKITQNYLQEL